MGTREYTVALAGNPNVGKSTVFNALTGMRQHTGNWPGKTVSSAAGSFKTSGSVKIRLIDVPGTYSLDAHSPEEEVAREFICAEGDAAPDAVIVVCDACSLRRNLHFAREIAETGKPYLLCINLADEAEKRGIKVDCGLLEELLAVPVVPCAARNGTGIDLLKRRLSELLESGKKEKVSTPSPEELWEACVTEPKNADRRERILDRILTGRFTAIPISAVLMAFIFFLTLKGAVPLSDGLSYLLSFVQGFARELLSAASVPDAVKSIICDGVIAVMCHVTAVMLPPMAIFFPLFTFLEDLGYLPRVAYNYDRCFKCCNACGKQALTMMMGLGCNAAGVTGCRIIDSPRERLVAILTNSLIPCNGRLAVISVIVSVLAALSGVSSGLLGPLFLCACVVLGIVLTFVLSKVLSATLLRGSASSFTLELPPYRLPKARQVIVRSVFDRTVFILGRAVAVAAPAGFILWLFENISIGGGSIFSRLCRLLHPIGSLAGMDGVMMCAFLLALPAAELILPVAIMGYSGVSLAESGFHLEGVSEVLQNAGWTPLTAVCAAIFTLVHFPCSTTVITVKRETGSTFYAAMSAVIPTVTGYILCVCVNLIFS